MCVVVRPLQYMPPPAERPQISMSCFALIQVKGNARGNALAMDIVNEGMKHARRRYDTGKLSPASGSLVASTLSLEY